MEHPPRPVPPKQIIQFRLINAYVEHWVKSHPDQPLTTTTEPKTTSTTMKSTTTPGKKGRSTTESVGSSTTTTDAGPAAPDSPIDQAVRAAVAREVEMGILHDLNNNQKTINSRQYIWSDSGDHTADFFGTVGAIRFRDVKATELSEQGELSADARKIPNLVVPGVNQFVTFKQFRGASLERGEDMETGVNDDLGINIVGGGPKTDEAADGGHGMVTFTTEWNWDDNSTHMDLGLGILSNGEPHFEEPAWRGTPED